LVEAVWVSRTPIVGIMARWVKMYKFYKILKIVIIDVLTDTSVLDLSLISGYYGWFGNDLMLTK
jgi:hypothetical protein